MTSIPPHVLETAWAQIHPHLDEVAALVPVDVAAELSPQMDLKQVLAGLVGALSGRVPDVEVPGLIAGLGGPTTAPPLSFRLPGWVAGVVTATDPATGGRGSMTGAQIPPRGSGPSFPPSAIPSLAAHCQSVAGELAQRLAGRADLAQTAEDGRDWAVRQGSRMIALGVLTARAAVRDLSRLTTLEDPEGLTLGLMNGLRLAILKRSLSASRGPAQARTPVPLDYRPQAHRGLAAVENHHWSLVEAGTPKTVLTDEAFRENGLASVIPGGVVVRTGVAHGQVFVTLTMADSAPIDPTGSWTEMVDMSYAAASGGATIAGMAGVATALEPGDYRVRVMARRRDDAEDPGGSGEEYEVVVWAAPAEPARIWAASDRLGHRMRRDAEPIAVPRPETAFRWIDDAMGEMGTVTIVTGMTRDEVLAAFGANPARPLADADVAGQHRVAVGSLGDAVVAIEFFGWQGSRPEVLRRASAQGRAASITWSINASTRFSMAEDGEVLDSFEYWSEATSPRVMELSDGLDLDTYVENIERGLVVAERFTGAGLTRDFVTTLIDAGLSYLVVPWLPDHHPFVESSDASFGVLRNEKHALLAASDQKLRDITWLTVGEIAQHHGANDPEIAATLQSRTLSPAAVMRARRAEVFRDPAGPAAAATWRVLHSATNPDPLAALLSVAGSVTMPLPWEVAILASLRSRLTGPPDQQASTDSH